ncbi:hypothetical protein [Peribacillus asahii]|uniref:hypothetical protein n=1 Tax=Peribacillus asahii TaxID=228899 RepID=UPI002079E688|nr:hypothetical protein [Peribacillus asahii]USK62334.1 hypothetical protein LIT37_22815 [Peribacillus asahii]
MLQQFKYWVLGLVLVAVIITAGLYYNHQNATVASVQEIEATLNTNITGHLRAEEPKFMTKKEWVSSVIADTAAVQKSNNGNLKVDLVFLDKQGKPTNEETNIVSVQVQTSVINKSGVTVTKSVKRISLSQK